MDDLKSTIEQAAQKFQEASSGEAPTQEQETTSAEVDDNITDKSSLTTNESESTSEAQATDTTEETSNNAPSEAVEATSNVEETSGKTAKFSSKANSSDSSKSDTSPDFENVNDYVEHFYKENDLENDKELREAILNKLGVQDSPSYANEFTAKLDRFISETGRSHEEFLFIENLNTEALQSSPIDAIRSKMALDNPSLSIDEIDLLVQDKYKLDEDEFTEREVQIGKARLKADSNEAIKSLNELKENYTKPVEGYTPPSERKPQSEVNVLGTDKDTYFNSLKEATDLGALSFEVNGEEFDFKLDDKYGGSLYSSLANEDPLSHVRNDDGSLNTQAVAEREALYQNIDKIVNAVYTKGKSDATSEVVRTKKNVDYTEDNTAPTVDSENRRHKRKRNQIRWEALDLGNTLIFDF